MKNHNIAICLSILSICAVFAIYNRNIKANEQGEVKTGYSVACLQQGQPGGKLIGQTTHYHLALSDRASNRCFYKFNNAFKGRFDAKDSPLTLDEIKRYDVITVSYRSPIYKELKNNPLYLWKALNFPWVSFTRADGPYAHLFTPTKGSKRHILIKPEGPLYTNWNSVCSVLGGDDACYP